jgi:hypothetical protein
VLSTRMHLDIINPCHAGKLGLKSLPLHIFVNLFF